MRVRLLGAIASAAVAGVMGTASAAELLSIKGLELGEKQFVSSFHIDTWAVRVLAVCRLPGGWTVVAGNNTDPQGELSGSASGGVAYIDRDHVGDLAGLFLVETDEVTWEARQNGNIIYPATFAGAYEIGMYGKDADNETKMPLTKANFELKPASECPPP